MSQIFSREIRLASRPIGAPTVRNFSTDRIGIRPLLEGEVMVRNHFMSVDPYMRGRMNEGESYIPPFALNMTLEGGAIGEVIASRSKDLVIGDTVSSNLGWREVATASAKVFHRIDKGIEPLSLYLGALGMTGMTAWVGLKVGGVKAGDVIYVSGAAGAVGSVAGQLAKIYGCRVIGSAGSEEKVSFLRNECGFDVAFDYRLGPVREQLSRVAPDGIDVYFDNVGGEAFEAALEALRIHGRIIACGGISGYNDAVPRPGPSNLSNMIVKRLTMTGMIVSDWLDQRIQFEEEMIGLISSGRVKARETMVMGLDNAVGAFLGIFQGRNIGKMVVKLP
jgi:NADPH-dependent curcumin reductase CurA